MADTSALDQVRRLWRHSHWADRALLAGLRALTEVPADVTREYGHIVGAQENWLARLEGREPLLAIWPRLSRVELESTAERTMAAYDDYLDRLDAAALTRSAHYRNSAGKEFDTPIGDILLHVPMHSQYHRGKVNLMLRRQELEPVPVDFITWVRGVPAAITPQK